MLHLEINVKRRHIYALVAAFAVILTIMPLASYAADKFNDVPDSNVFHNDIAWLASVGVTKGCNPPANDEFCPGDAVTREQMAAFMHRLAVNKIVDAATAGDADTVDGVHANEMIRGAALSTPSNVDNWDGTEIEDTVTVETPSRGLLVMLYTVNLGKDNGGGGTGIQEYSVEGRLDGALLGDFDNLFEVDFDGANDTTESYQRVITVDAGTYDVSVALSQSGAPTTDTTFIYDRSLTVLFVPFDGAGATPAGISTDSGPSGSNN